MNRVRREPPRSIPLFVSKIFAASPLMALALCVSLATILWCIMLARRQRGGLDKILTGLIGMIAIYEALRILKDSGVVAFAGARQLDGFADFIVACLSLVAALILRVSSIDRATTKAQLRLVEANEKPIDLPKSGSGPFPELKHMLFDASPLAVIAVDLQGIVSYSNPAAESLIGWTRDELLGHSLPFSVQGPIVDKTGTEVDAAFWTSSIYGSTGTARGTLMIAVGAIASEAGKGQSKRAVQLR